jgi:glyoxylase-like metal-dependent hydrolase (beta-lactamase superfamily II)
MKLSVIETGNFMLDGGAMFGVVPKSLWEKVYPADENNLCNLSMRCLLVDNGEKRVLIDTGMGSKQDEKFTRHYYLNGNFTLEKSLAQAGYEKSDITDVVLTHLHFDHCGGAVEYNSLKTAYKPTFPNAIYRISKPQWEWAVKPNYREKASFLHENILPILESGQISLFENTVRPIPEMELRLFNGHTDGQAIPFIRVNGKTIVFTADLLPTMAHIPISWICGFDTRPLLSLDEHESFLQEALDNEYILFFEHDIQAQCCRLQQTEKGIRAADPRELAAYLKD